MGIMEDWQFKHKQTTKGGKIIQPNINRKYVQLLLVQKPPETQTVSLKIWHNARKDVQSVPLIYMFGSIVWILFYSIIIIIIYVL